MRIPLRGHGEEGMVIALLTAHDGAAQEGEEHDGEEHEKVKGTGLDFPDNSWCSLGVSASTTRLAAGGRLGTCSPTGASVAQTDGTSVKPKRVPAFFRRLLSIPRGAPRRRRHALSRS